MKRRNVLYLIEALDLGGAEQVVLHLALGLDRERFQPMVACLTTRGRFAPALEKAGVPVFCLDKRPKLDGGLIPRLKRLLGSESVDLIHSHLFTANLWGRLAAWGERAPVVVTEHSVDTWKPWTYRCLDHLLKPLTTHWVFVSQQVRDFYERRMGPLPNACVIRNGVPLPPLSTAPDGRRPLTLGTVGRLAPEKELLRFVELVEALYKEGLPVRGRIVGDGPEKGRLEEAIRSRDLEEVVERVGFVPQMEEEWARMDLFVLTSSREGLPLTALEAMARGLPVLSTAVGGVPECVEDGKEGWLVPYGDWTALRERARGLLQDEGSRRRMGQAGRARVERQFRVERMVQEHEALYQRLLEGRSG